MCTEDDWLFLLLLNSQATKEVMVKLQEKINDIRTPNQLIQEITLLSRASNLSEKYLDRKPTTRDTAYRVSNGGGNKSVTCWTCQQKGHTNKSCPVLKNKLACQHC